MIINRVRAIPNKWTFLIPQIADLLKEEMAGFEKWLDPFCGENSPAQIKNDLNPNVKADYHLNAIEFLKLFDASSADGVLVDPPYSPRQVSDCYKGFGRNVTSRDTQGRPLILIRNEVARVVRPGGKVICFGWNSCGIGESFGFQLIKILLVCHSAVVNDTIITIERKIQSGFNEVESDIELEV